MSLTSGEIFSSIYVINGCGMVRALAFSHSRAFLSQEGTLLIGLIILGVSIVVQLLAALAALTLIRATGWRNAWILIATAFMLMAARRAITFHSIFVTDGGRNLHLAAELVALTISVLMLAGVLLIRPIFESFFNAERNLKLSKLRYKSLFEGADIAILSVDYSGLDQCLNRIRDEGVKDLHQYLADHPDQLSRLIRLTRLIDVNPATLRLFKSHSVDQFRSQLDEIFDSGLFLLFEKQLHAIWEQWPTFESEMTCTSLNDEKITLLAKSTIPKTEAGFSNLVISMLDITERKRAAEAQQISEKLMSVGTLAGGIAHDFNNLLTGIFGNLELVKSHLASDHPSQAYVKRSQAALSRATSLTRQLLTFSTGGEPVIENTNLGDLIVDTVRFDLAGSNVSAKFDLDHNEVMVKIDRGQIEAVISNLVINADQAMPDGGIVTIAMKPITIREGHSLVTTAGDYVQVTIADQGSGIEEKDIDRIFEPYFSTKESGSGLGLATSYSVITKHGGFIGCKSKLEVGTLFTLYLPLTTSVDADHPVTDNSVSLVQSVPLPAQQNRIVKVLVMDDEQMILEIAADILELEGCSVDTALDGAQAIQMYQDSVANGEVYDFLIMDLTIPGGMGGMEAIKEILKIDPTAVAVVCSGYAEDPVLANVIGSGFKGSVAKPYTRADLRRALNLLPGHGGN